MFFLFHFLPAFASQLAISVLLFRSHFPGFSPYSRPGFPCHLSGSVYLAFCLFPFALPCFAPTAVPQVLTFFHLSISLRCFPLLLLSFVRFRLGSDYSASVSSFPFIPASPHSGSFRCLFIRFPFRLFPCFRSCFGTQLSCFSFHRLTVSHHRCYFSCRPPVSSSVVPLSFRLRFWLLSLGDTP